jgi:YD repeat-containing protein
VNLVTDIKYPDGMMNYFYYDAQLRRYAMQDSGGLRYFTWDSNGMNLLCERDAAGSVTAYYSHGYTPIDGIGSMVAAKQNAYSASYYQYPVYDHRGTVVRLVDQDGNPTAYYEYDAWGNEISDKVFGGVAENRFRYQSNWIELKDSYSYDKLYLSPTRIYDAGIGRFMGRDPRPPLEQVHPDQSQNIQGHMVGEYEAPGSPSLMDPNGKEVLSKCSLEDYLGKHLTRFYWTRDEVGYHYSSVADYRKGEMTSEILGKMILSHRDFVIDGNSNKSCIDNLKKHVALRADIVRRAETEPPGCKLGCAAITFGILREAGYAAQKGFTMEKYVLFHNVTDRGDWIPGDVAYIKNVNNSNVPGEEGENVIFMGPNKDAKKSYKLWGYFPGDKAYYRTLDEWEKEMIKWTTVGLFGNRLSNGKPGKLKPDRRTLAVGLRR